MPPLWIELAAYAGLGAVAGFFAGLLGIGGGAIIGPILIFIYTGMLDFPAEHATHIAIATATGVIVLTAPISAATHARQQNIDWTLARRISIGAILGALAGAHGAALAPAVALKLLLMLFLFANTINMLLPARAATTTTDAGTPTIPPAELLPVSCAIGALSAVLGIGGGALTVPYLYRRGVQMRRAIGCSAFVGLPLSLAAAAGYLATGADVDNLPAGSIGYLYLPALTSIALFSTLAAHAGARLTNKLPSDLLRKIFALLTALVAARLLVAIVQAA